MSKRSGAVALTATIMVTVFVAAMTFVFNPHNDDKEYASLVLEEAKRRQSAPVTVVAKPLETDIEVLRQEDIMAGKVSAILLSDEGFIGEMGDISAKYVGEKISDLEEIYASDTNERILKGDEESRAYSDGVLSSSKAYADEKEALAKSYSDSSDALINKEVESLKAEISQLKGEIDTMKEKALKTEDVLSSMLQDEVFMSTLSKEVSNRVGVDISVEDLTAAILSSESYNSGLAKAMDDYHVALDSAHSIPIPVFDTATSEEYSEEEYLEKRNESRGEEIDKILSFLGY